MMKVSNCIFVVLILSALGRAQPAPGPSPAPVARSERQSVGAAQKPQEVGEGDVLRISAGLVSVPVSVIDRKGQYVLNLAQEDFHVYEDGVEQPIVHFSNTNQPIAVVLLIDSSSSTAPFIDQIKRAAKAFVEQLRPADTIRPVYFHGEIKSLTTEGINDPKLLDEAIDQIRPGPINLGTRLYDAVDFGLRTLKPAAARKAVILITDGENTWGKATMKSTLREAEESDIIVYTLQYGDLEPQKYLQQLADKTGGRYFKGAETNALRQTFVQIAQELRRQYVLGYHASELAQTERERKIKVRVARKDVAVRARRSYVYRR